MVDTARIDWDAVAEASPHAGVRSRRVDTEHLTVVRYSLDEGAAYPLHSHPEEQLVHVLEGEIELTVDGSTSRLRAGDAFYVAGGVEHGARGASSGTAHFLNIVAPRRP